MNTYIRKIEEKLGIEYVHLRRIFKKGNICKSARGTDQRFFSLHPIMLKIITCPDCKKILKDKIKEVAGQTAQKTGIRTGGYGK